MDFSQAFSDFLVRAGKSQAGFAREVGVTGPLINMIIKRKATPPMDRIEGWAEALGLTGDDRTVFLDLAALAHLPSEVQVRFIGIYLRYSEMMRESSRINAEQNTIGGGSKDERGISTIDSWEPNVTGLPSRDGRGHDADLSGGGITSEDNVFRK